jgi:hypothetical protein
MPALAAIRSGGAAGASTNITAWGKTMSTYVPPVAVAARKPLIVDRSELARFVEAIFPRAERGTFVSLRAFDQFCRDRPPELIWPVRLGADRSHLIARAVEAAARCAGTEHPTVFAPPIATFSNAVHAGTADLANGLAISAEQDVGDSTAGWHRLEQPLGPATIVVASGGYWTDPATGKPHAKLHTHWRLATPTRTPDDHERLRQARDLAARLIGADPTAAPPAHPLRWPGSWNTKDVPRLARIIAYNPDAEVQLDVALAALEAAAEAAGLEAAGMPQSNDPQAALPLLQSAMAAIPNNDRDVHYRTWILLGYACFRATGGADVGFALWDAWSRQSAKYDAKEQRATWRRIVRAVQRDTTRPTVGAGTIFFYAQQAGWSRPVSEPPAWLNDIPEHPGDDVVVHVVPLRDHGATRRYALGALRKGCKRVIDGDASTLRKELRALARFVRIGALTADEVAEALAVAAVEIGLPEHVVVPAIDNALGAA